MKNLMLEYALSYIAEGWSVLPLQERGKEPVGYLVRNGYKSATTDPATAIKWWGKNPKMNIGIACAASGLVVFDVDYRNGGSGVGLAPTLTVSTGNGLHFYYTAQEGARFPGKYRHGVDIKHNGYVVAAPSIHPNGKIYTVVSPSVQRRAIA